MTTSKVKQLVEKFRQLRKEPKGDPIYDWDILHAMLIIKSIRTFILVLLSGTLLGVISSTVPLAGRSSTLILFIMLFALSFSFNLIQLMRTKLEGSKAVDPKVWGKTMYYTEEKKVVVKIYKILLYVGDTILFAFIILNFFV